MAPTWIETDVNTNKDINAAVSVGVYTSTGDKFVMPQLLADQVAGGGDYVYYVTLQVAGAGSHYVIGPKTTHTAAAGETAIGAQGGFIAVRNGDVLTVYIDGLAGDTATPDVTVRWFELDASTNVKQWKSETPGDLDGSGNVPTGAPSAADIWDGYYIEGEYLPSALLYAAASSAGTAASNASDAFQAANLVGTKLNSMLVDPDEEYPQFSADALANAPGGDLSIDAQDIANAGLLAPVGDPADGSAMAYLASIDADTGTTLPAQIALISGGGGSGTGSYTDTITDGTNPLDGVRVQLSTDSAGANIAYETFTNALGVFVLRPDPGTYYRWLDLAGFTFTQGVEVEVESL